MKQPKTDPNDAENDHEPEKPMTDKTDPPHPTCIEVTRADQLPNREWICGLGCPGVNTQAITPEADTGPPMTLTVTNAPEGTPTMGLDDVANGLHEGEAAERRRHVVRGGHGRFDKNPDAAHVDAECCRLRARSMSYTQIAAELGISVSRAYNGVKNGIAAIVREPAEDALALELEKLDNLERTYLDILQDVHPVLYQGQDTGFQDNGPKMQALAGLLRTSESRRKLLGLDQPAKVAVSGGIAYTLNGVDLKDVT